MMLRKVFFPVIAILIVAFIVAGFVGQDRKVSKPITSVEERIKALETEIAELKSIFSEGSRNLQVANIGDVKPVKGGSEPFSGSRAWTEGTRGWEEDGTNLWTGTAPLNYRVGIGTATPSASYKLDINGSGVNGRGLIVRGYNYGISVSVNTPVAATSVALSASNTSTLPGQPIGVKGEAWNVGVETNGIGGKFEGGKYGVYGIVTPTGSNDYYGVLGAIAGGSGTNCGVKGSATGGVTNYGVHGSASGGTNNYAGYFDGNLNIHNGKILINESATANKVLTTDGSGDPQWSDTPSDGDWTVYGDSIYSAVSGEVWIGYTSSNPPTQAAALCTYHAPTSGKGNGIYSIGKLPNGNINMAQGGWFIGDNSVGNGDACGIYATAKCKLATKACYGGKFYAGQGGLGPDCTEYGIYAQVSRPSNDDSYAGYFKGKSYFDGSGADYAGYFNGKVDVAQNTRINLGTAYISSSASGGIEYASFSSNAWFDGTTWHIPDASNRSGTFIWAEQDFMICRTQTAGAADWLTPLVIDNAGLIITDDTPRKPNAGDWSGGSDRRLKKNIQPLKDALKKVLALKGQTFEWKQIEDIRGENLPENRRRSIESGDFPEGEQMGFIAQESIDIIPSLVEKENDGYYMMQYGSLDPLLVSAIQEQQKEIESLTDEVRILKETTEELSSLKAELEKLKTQIAHIGITSPWQLARE